MIKRITKFLRTLITISIIGGAIGIIGVLWFFVWSEAPILRGKIDYGVKYKKGLSVDIYHPTIDVYDLPPVLVFIHGGAWVGGRKETMNMNRYHDAFNRLRERGYMVVSPEYTLAKKGRPPFPDCITDIIEFLDWMKQENERYKFDLDNIGVFGESAGAHIAMMAAMADTVGGVSHNLDIKYMIDVYGPTDLYGLYVTHLTDSTETVLSRVSENNRSKMDCSNFIFGFDMSDDTLKAISFSRELSPIHYVGEGNPPLLIIHGSKDHLVPVRQSLEVRRKFEEQGLEVQLKILKNVDHNFLRASEEQRGQVQDWIVEFVEAKYHQPNN